MIFNPIITFTVFELAGPCALCSLFTRGGLDRHVHRPRRTIARPGWPGAHVEQCGELCGGRRKDTRSSLLQKWSSNGEDG